MQPALRQITDAEWEVVENYTLLGRTVPAGFRCDMASVPRWAWPVIPPTGLHGGAAVLHDFLYSTGLVPKVEADAYFFEAMRSLGVPRWRRVVMYLAVVIGGGEAWAAHRAEYGGRGRSRTGGARLMRPR